MLKHKKEEEQIILKKNLDAHLVELTNKKQTKIIKISDLPSCTSIKKNIRLLGEKTVLKAICLMISQGMDCFATKSRIEEKQIGSFAEWFILHYKDESFEDLIVTFDNIKSGMYGKGLVADQVFIMECFDDTLDKKAIERELAEDRKETEAVNNAMHKAREINAKKEIKPLTKELVEKLYEEKEEWASNKRMHVKEKQEDIEYRKKKRMELLEMYAHLYGQEQLEEEHEFLQSMGWMDLLPMIDKHLKKPQPGKK